MNSETSLENEIRKVLENSTDVDWVWNGVDEVKRYEFDIEYAIQELLKLFENRYMKDFSGECPYYSFGTDGVHTISIDKCNHPNNKHWNKEDKLRTVEVLVDGEWKKVSHFRELKIGDIFRMFEPYGDPVVSSYDGSTEWLVAKSPYQNEDGTWQVMIDKTV